jgi:hypothetical protein
MYEYRAGRFDSAAQWFEDARRFYEPGREQWKVACLTQSLYWLAMTHHKLGDSDAATKAYRNAESRFRQATLTTEPAIGGGGSWHDWLQAAVTRREARAVLDLGREHGGYLGSRSDDGSAAPNDAEPVPLLNTEELPALPEGTALYMSFEEDTTLQRGDTLYVRDLSGSGDVWKGNNVAFAADGKVGGALAIEAGRLEFPRGLLTGQAEYTVAAWVCQRGHYYFDILTQWKNGRQLQYFAVFHNGYCHFGVWGSDQHEAPTKSKKVTAPAGLAPRGEWSFVIARYQEVNAGQGVLDLWVNDRLATSSPFPSMGDRSDVRSHVGRKDQQLGLVDELMVFHRALNDQEIHQLYQMGLDGIALGSENALQFPAPPQGGANRLSPLDSETRSVE